MNDWDHAAEIVKREAQKQHEQKGDFASLHEAYGALAEEQAEMLDALRRKDWVSAVAELVQIAAIGMTIVYQMERKEKEG